MFAPTDWATAGPAYPGADAEPPPPAAAGRRKRPKAAAATADAVVSLADVLAKDAQPVKHDTPAKKKKEKRRGGDDTLADPSTPAPAQPARGAREKRAHAAAAAHAARPASLGAVASPPAPVDTPKKKNKKRVRDDDGTAASPPPPLVVLPAAGADAQATTRPPPKKPGKRNKFKPQQQQETEDAAAEAPAPAPPSRTPTLDRFRARLAAGAFRALNEALYTRPGAASFAEFSSSPDLFAQYHAGFRAAVAKWPASPLAAAISFVKALPRASSVVDFGCGEAGLAAAVGQHAAVTSLDLVAAAPGVIVCDMAATPLPTSTADAAIFCLALMGTDYPAALAEAGRVLKPGGWLWIAEVRSRFVAAGSTGAKDDVRPFVGAVCGLGFEAAGVDAGNPMFVVLKFRKKKGGGGGGRAPPFPDLKPCTYKRR